MTAMMNEGTNRSEEPEYFSYIAMVINVKKIKTAVNPKFETRSESIMKLKINTPTTAGIFFMTTPITDPIRKTAGKLITVVSSITENIHRATKRLISW